MLKLYGFSKVNAGARGNTRDLRVLWALDEMQLPFELVGMDHPAHDLNTNAYRTLSPFEQIPAIDDEGVVLSESAAILIYLAHKTGKLIPNDPAGQRKGTLALEQCEIRRLGEPFLGGVEAGDSNFVPDNFIRGLDRQGEGFAIQQDFGDDGLFLDAELEGLQFDPV